MNTFFFVSLFYHLMTILVAVVRVKRHPLVQIQLSGGMSLRVDWKGMLWVSLALASAVSLFVRVFYPTY